MKYIFCIIIISLWVLNCDAQRRVRGRDFTQSAKDSIESWGSGAAGVSDTANVLRTEWRTDINDSLENIGRYNVLQFGAIANDGLSDTEEIQAAISTSNVNYLIIGNSLADTFEVRTSINLKSNMRVEVNGVIKAMDSDIRLLTQNASIGDDTIYVASPATYFSVGETIAISDSAMNFHGQAYGGADRYNGVTTTISAVGSDFLVLTDTIKTYNFTTANGAQIGHVTDVFHSENADNVQIFGTGVIDGNRDNQFNVQAIQLGDTIFFNSEKTHYHLSGWATYVGSSIAFYSSDNVKIRDVEIRNSHSYGVQWLWCDSVYIDNSLIYNTHTKGVLSWFTNYVWITNAKVDSTVLDDGIAFYRDTDHAWVTNSTISRSARYGMLVSALQVATDVTCTNNFFKNNGMHYYIGSSRFTSINERFKGGGKYSFTSTARYAIQVDGITAIAGATEDITFINPQCDSLYSTSLGWMTFQNDINNVKIIGGRIHRSRDTGYGITLFNGVDSVFVSNVTFKDMVYAIANDTTNSNVYFDRCSFTNVDDIFYNESNTVYFGGKDKLFMSAGPGYYQEKNGLAWLLNGNTFVDVAHGLPNSPKLQHIQVTPNDSLGDATNFWASEKSATQFRINIDADPNFPIDSLMEFVYADSSVLWAVDNDSLDLETNDFTIAFKFQDTGVDTINGTIIAKGSENSAPRWNIYAGHTTQEGYILFIFRYDADSIITFITDSPVDDGEPHFIVVVGDRDGYLTSYIDGKQDKQFTMSDYNLDVCDFNNTDTLMVGNFGIGNNTGVSAYVDNIGIWEDALSLAEVIELYNGGGIKSYSSNSGDYTSSGDLMGYWKFDTPSATTLSDEVGKKDLTNGAATGTTQYDGTAGAWRAGIRFIWSVKP